MILTFVSLFSGILSAQEFDATRLSHILKALKLDKAKVKEELCIEKKIPNAEDSYIAVIPVIVGSGEDEYNFTIRNYIVITDGNGTIRNQYFDPTEIISDAIMLTGLTIDTGLYTIGTNIRAFGVKVDFTGSSRPNPYSSETISLYYPEGKTLRKVLDQFELDSSHGEWDTRCNGEFENRHSVMIIGTAKTNNFSDIKIKTTSVTTINKDLNGECEGKETSKTSYKTLQFKNGKYQ
ncbi:hypothetical protein EG341_03680 [Chryseobacterium lactis]|nr:hypothetical protein EG342_12815 [Chryseobacterium lactis]AZB03082.1 hypothetical protein EG341_03680 [Chryseobacterium lactis]